MWTQEVIDFIDETEPHDQHLMTRQEVEKWKEKRKEVIEYLRKLSGVH